MQSGEIDYSKLTPEMKQKLADIESKKPDIRSAKSLEEISLLVQEAIKLIAEPKDDTSEKEMGTVFSDIKGLLTEIRDKEDVEMPDYSKPLLGAFDKLEKAMVGAVNKIDIKPQVNPEVNVAAPNVNVASPDLKGVEKVLKTDIPNAFKEAIALIPKVPKTDLTPVEEALSSLAEQLSSIDTGVRMKPHFPNIMKVSNSDGTSVGSDFFKIVPFVYDDIQITSYTANNDPITVQYRSAGVLVATLTITYDGTNRITRVART